MSAEYTAQEITKLFEGEVKNRSTYEEHWSKMADYCLPKHSPLWGRRHQDVVYQSSWRSEWKAYDSIGMDSAQRLTAIYQDLIAPKGRSSHKYLPKDRELAHRGDIVSWLTEASDLVTRNRWTAESGFGEAIWETLLSYAVYGVGVMYVGQRKLEGGKIRTHYFPIFLRDVYYKTNSYGELEYILHSLWLSESDFQKRFPGQSEPTHTKPPSAPGKRRRSVIHYCYRKTSPDYELGAFDDRRYLYGSKYVLENRNEGGPLVLQDQGEPPGYVTCPYIIPRFYSTSQEAYSTSTLGDLLPIIITINQMEKSHLQIARKAANPILLASEDAALRRGGFDLRPGALNYGAVSADGKRLVQEMDPGRYDISGTTLNEKKIRLERALGLPAGETRRKTALEVTEELKAQAESQQGAHAALQERLIAPLALREIQLLDDIGELPPGMPPELDNQQWDVEPETEAGFSEAAQEVSGFGRVFELAASLSEAKQDPSVFDVFDEDTIISEAGDILGMPIRWFRSQREVDDIRGKREEQVAVAGAVSAAPAVASLVKSGG